MGKILKYLFPVFGIVPVLAAILHSCNDAGCMDNRSSIPFAQFYDKSNLQTAISIDSITIYGIDQKNDSLIVDSARTLSSVSLPFRDNDTITQFVLQYNYTWNKNRKSNDTLTFVYRPYVFFASVDCGVMFNYTLKEHRYTRHILDSIVVVTPEITNQNVENIKLVFPTQENEE